MNVMVRWNNSLSDVLRVRSSVRQGGVLSPYLFNVYADVFINNIVTRSRGCHVKQTYMACVMYTDDLLLLSASLAGLQELLDVCILTSSDLCLTFNEAKSHCLLIGPHCHTHLADVFLAEKSLNWARSIKYVSMELMAGSSFDID